jgi:hypothetical protein
VKAPRAPHIPYDPTLDPDVFGVEDEPAPTHAGIAPVLTPPPPPPPKKLKLTLPRTPWEITAEMIAQAVAEGRHTRMDVANGIGLPTNVCGGCRQLKPTYHVAGVAGGAGLAGRVEYCKACCEARGIK